jgi:hypothetical protein
VPATSGPGDEVVVPAFGMVATAFAALAVGVVPILADVRRGRPGEAARGFHGAVHLRRGPDSYKARVRPQSPCWGGTPLQAQLFSSILARWWSFGGSALCF